MSLALGKIIQAGTTPTPEKLAKTKVSMFFVRVQQGERLNNLEIIRLKDKLGTQQLPTAELLLKGTEAHLVGS